MKGIAQRLLFALTISAGVLCANGQDSQQAPEKRLGVFSIHFENDLFNGTDRWNTSNQQISYAFTPKHTWEDTVLPFWMSAPARWIPWMNAPDAQKIVGITAGQQFFTPTTKMQPVPDPAQRPYAGWLYANLSWVAQTQKTRDILQLSLGVVGPWALGKETQDFAHDHLAHVEKFLGWDYQLPNEPAIVIAYERTWRVAQGDFGENFTWDFLPSAGIVVGNVFDYVNAGFMLRAGWHLPDDFGPQTMHPAELTAPAFSAHASDLSIYGFFGAEGRAIARNIFLDGSTFKDSPSIAKRYAVAEVQAGLALRYQRVSFIFSQVFRTEEFRNQGRPQWFCSARLNIEF